MADQEKVILVIKSLAPVLKRKVIPLENGGVLIIDLTKEEKRLIKIQMKK